MGFFNHNRKKQRGPVYEDGYKPKERPPIEVNPYTGSDIAPWFGGGRRRKTDQEIDAEWQAKINERRTLEQREYQEWQTNRLQQQQQDETAAWRAQMERVQREYKRQRKEMQRRMEEQRIAAENQMAAAKAKSNKMARPEAGAYEGEPQERRGGGDDGGASGTLLTKQGARPTLGKRGSLGSKTLLGG